MQRPFQSSSASDAETDAAEAAAAAPELTRSGQHQLSWMLRQRKKESMFDKLPQDVIDKIDQELIDIDSVKFCRRLSSIMPNSRMDPEVFLEKCSDFLKDVQVFITKMSLGRVNPKKRFVFGYTCLEYVERKCLIILNEMLFYNFKNVVEQLDEVKIQIDVLRNIIIHPFAENRNTANKAMLTEVLDDDSKLKMFLSSTDRVMSMCIEILKSNTVPLVVKDFEEDALTLLEESSDMLISILRNEHISVELKKETMDIFSDTMFGMYSVFEQAQEAGVVTQVQGLTRLKYRELKIKYNAIKEYLEEKYPPRQGGYYKKQSKNKSKINSKSNKNINNSRNKKNNSRNKKNKNRKKTLHLRN